jgi:uncharacterized protein (TIGR03790 family)
MNKASCWIFFIALISCSWLRADSLPSQTIVVYNDSLPESKDLAEFYAQARNIPLTNLVGLQTSKEETISRAEFQQTILDPLRTAFTQRQWWTIKKEANGQNNVTANQKKIFALMWGVPLRIAPVAPAPGPVDPKTGQAPPVPAPAAGQQNEASVDSELVLFGASPPSYSGGVNNPLFNKPTAFNAEAPPFIMLVGRIDGPSPAVCRRMVKDALTAEKTGLWGRVFLDLARKGPGYDEGDLWLLGAGKALGAAGYSVTIDAHPQTLPTNYPMTETALYFGWYTRSIDGPFVNPSFKFLPGAIACHLHSYCATTVRSTTAEWCGPLLARGAAATFGTVWEPYLAMFTRFDVFTDRLLKGAPLAEAMWLATPAISWMNVVLGDPLYRPFANTKSDSPSGPGADYQVLHSTLRRLAQEENKDKLIAAIKDTAKARNSGRLWEAAGLISQTYFPDDMITAAECFEKAANTYTATPDKIRAYLHVPDLERRNDKIDGALSDLKGIIDTFPQAPETEAAKAWFNTLRPPPPPPAANSQPKKK